MSDSNLVAFGGFSPEAAADARQEAQDEGNEFYKLKGGWNIVRVIPPMAGADTPFRKVFMHFLPTDKPDRNMPVVCPRMTKVRNSKGDLVSQNRSCIICEKASELRASANQLNKDKGYDMQAKPNIYCCIVVKDKNGDIISPIKVLKLSKGLYDDIIEIREDPEDPCDFTHPIEGYDLRIHRKGTSKTDTEYTVKVAKRSSYLASDEDGGQDVTVMNELITEQLDLDTYASLPDDDDIIAALEAGPDGGGGGRSRRRLSSGDKSAETQERRSRRRAKPEADSEEMDGSVAGEAGEGDDNFPESM